MNTETWVKEYTDGAFTVKIGYDYEDIPLSQLFEEDEVDELARKIDAGQLDYFIALVKYFYKDIEVGCASLGGNLYEDAVTALDQGLSGYLPQMIEEAQEEAEEYIAELREDLENDFA